MTGTQGSGRCPLCGGAELIRDSIPEPNLYSEKLALLLGGEEDRLLQEHPNWRCRHCGLVFKRRWFPDSVIGELFSGAVAVHPRGWDTVLDRFCAPNFISTLDRWSVGVAGSLEAQTRRGERELLSLIDSITAPSGFERAAVVAAIRGGEVDVVRAAADAIAGSITQPAPFKRFSGFRSAALWEYLQERTGGFDRYAEVGCPLWGLLSMAAGNDVEATYLSRREVNYWAEGCAHAGRRCSMQLLADSPVRSAKWTDGHRFPLLGVFQYLDHPRAPDRFLSEVFALADSAAFIVDAMDSPLAIQHVTGWPDTAFDHVADRFGKRVHADFTDIRPSGNRLYLLTGTGP